MIADVKYIMWCMKLLFIKWCLVESTIILELIFSTHQNSSCGFLSTFFQLAKYDAVILINVARGCNGLFLWYWFFAVQLIWIHKSIHKSTTIYVVRMCWKHRFYCTCIVVGSMLITNLTMLTLTLGISGLLQIGMMQSSWVNTFWGTFNCWICAKTRPVFLQLL